MMYNRQRIIFFSCATKLYGQFILEFLYGKEAELMTYKKVTVNILLTRCFFFFKAKLVTIMSLHLIWKKKDYSLLSEYFVQM